MGKHRGKNKKKDEKKKLFVDEDDNNEWKSSSSSSIAAVTGLSATQPSSISHISNSTVPILNTLSIGSPQQKEIALLKINEFVVKTSARSHPEQIRDLRLLVKNGLIRKIIPLLCDSKYPGVRFQSCSTLVKIVNLYCKDVNKEIHMSDIWTPLGKSIHLCKINLDPANVNTDSFLIAVQTIESILEATEILVNSGIKGVIERLISPSCDIVNEILLFLTPDFVSLSKSLLGIYQRSLSIICLIVDDIFSPPTNLISAIFNKSTIIENIQQISGNQQYLPELSLVSRMDASSLLINLALISVSVSSDRNAISNQFVSFQNLAQHALAIDTTSATVLNSVKECILMKEHYDLLVEQASIAAMNGNSDNDGMNTESTVSTSAGSESSSASSSKVEPPANYELKIKELEKWLDIISAQTRAVDIVRNVVVDSMYKSTSKEAHESDDEEDNDMNISNHLSSSSSSMNSSNSQNSQTHAIVMSILREQAKQFMQTSYASSLLKVLRDLSIESEIKGSSRGELLSFHSAVVDCTDAILQLAIEEKQSDISTSQELIQLLTICAETCLSIMQSKTKNLFTDTDEKVISSLTSLMWTIARLTSATSISPQILEFSRDLCKSPSVPIEARTNLVGFLGVVAQATYNDTNGATIRIAIAKTLLDCLTDDPAEDVLCESCNALIDLYSNDDHDDELNSLSILQSFEQLLSSLMPRKKSNKKRNSKVGLSEQLQILVNDMAAFISYKQGHR